jgi:putative ABC transport system permease protein
MQDKQLGFEKEQVLVIKNADRLKEQQDAFKQEILNQPGVLNACSSYSVPGTFFVSSLYRPLGSSADKDRQLQYTWVDQDFLKTYNIKILQGRGFSKDFPTDTTAVLLNKKAAQVFGWEEAINKRLTQGNLGDSWTVVGVMDDFHFKSLHQEIKPLALFYRSNLKYFSVKMQSENISKTLTSLKTVWADFAPHVPFEYSFLDDDFNSLYKTEMRLEQVFRTFTALAIFIACLGLLGLATYTAAQRTKEIGVRKVLGASLLNIMTLLSKDFIRLVGIAFLTGSPIAYFVMNRWLRDFAYRRVIGIEIFLLTGAIAFFLSVVTVSFQAVKAALADPARSIRYE